MLVTLKGQRKLKTDMIQCAVLSFNTLRIHQKGISLHCECIIKKKRDQTNEKYKLDNVI